MAQSRANRASSILGPAFDVVTVALVLGYALPSVKVNAVTVTV